LLRGNHPAKVDDKGRLKIPNGFLQLLLGKYGPDVFVTSVTGESVRVYPMEVWIELERKWQKMPDSHPTKDRLLLRVNFFGQPAAFDKQGRLIIPALLRDQAQMAGEVAVLGRANFLEIWNRARLLEKLKNEPFTEEDGRVTASFDI
jgi:MraZ protein